MTVKEALGAIKPLSSLDILPGCPFAKEMMRSAAIAGLKRRKWDFDEKEIPYPDLKPRSLLVDYRMPINKQCSLLGIYNWLNLDYHKDLHPKPQGRWGWICGVEDGKKMLGKSPNQAIEEFGRNNRRGLMTVEGLALLRENLDLFKDHFIDFSGSRCESPLRVPYGYLDDGGRPVLSWNFSFVSDGRWGSASCLSR